MIIYTRLNIVSLHKTNLAVDSPHFEDIEKYQFLNYEMVEVNVDMTVYPANENSSCH